MQNTLLNKKKDQNFAMNKKNTYYGLEYNGPSIILSFLYKLSRGIERRQKMRKEAV